MSDGTIADGQITASSSRNGTHPQAARLHRQPRKTQPIAFWQPADTDKNPYIQIQFRENMRIYGISTQGHFNRAVKEFATEYQLSYFNRKSTWVSHGVCFFFVFPFLVY